MEAIARDLRYGIRLIRRSPAVALVAILSLGLGIGGAAAVFGLTDALLFRELPVTAPRELAIMLGVSLIAAFIPAHRASRVDPRVALRAE